MKIDYALAIYLYRFGHLPLPGSGHLFIHNEPARLSFPDRKIYPGATHIQFSNTNLAETHLLSWLSLELGADITNVSDRVSSWLNDLKVQLKSGSPVVWQGIGELSISDDETLLVQIENPFMLIPSEGLTAEKVIRVGAPHSVLVGESEKSRSEMEEALQPKARRSKKLWPYILIILFSVAALGFWLIITYYPDAWNRKGNHGPINIEETPSRSHWIP
jgi:hypothetical protein